MAPIHERLVAAPGGACAAARLEGEGEAEDADAGDGRDSAVRQSIHTLCTQNERRWMTCQVEIELDRWEWDR
jgi:hypothetical protein